MDANAIVYLDEGDRGELSTARLTDATWPILHCL
ncbi:hypothetical protein BVRB_3g053750 [Beta vulgaris subsp. vulgaris]|nr:hypothetical protein BVRB_3g053750 [Beta vulgaris subsp. vulgaris]